MQQETTFLSDRETINNLKSTKSRLTGQINTLEELIHALQSHMITHISNNTNSNNNEKGNYNGNRNGNGNGNGNSNVNVNLGWLFSFWISFHLIQKGTGITEITVIYRNSCFFGRYSSQIGISNLGLKELGMEGNHSSERNYFDWNSPQKGMLHLGLKEPKMYRNHSKK